MQEILLGLQILGIVGIWVIVFWLTKLISSLKTGIDAQKTIIDSMSSQAEYIGNIHNTVSRLYNPAEIENLVSVKTQHQISKYRNALDELSKNSDKSIQALYKFVGSSVTHLSSSQLNEIFGRIDPELRSAELEKFALELRIEIEKIRSDALINALSGSRR